MNTGVDLISEINANRSRNIGSLASGVGNTLLPSAEERMAQKATAERLAEQNRDLTPVEQQVAGGYFRGILKRGGDLGPGVDPATYIPQAVRSMNPGDLARLEKWHAELIAAKAARPSPAEAPRAVFNLDVAANAALEDRLNAARTAQGPQGPLSEDVVKGAKTAVTMDVLVRDVLPNLNNAKARITISPEYAEPAYFAKNFRKRVRQGNINSAMDLARQAASGVVVGANGVKKPVNAVTQQLAADVLKAATVPATSGFFGIGAQPERTELPLSFR